MPTGKLKRSRRKAKRRVKKAAKSLKKATRKGIKQAKRVARKASRKVEKAAKTARRKAKRTSRGRAKPGVPIGAELLHDPRLNKGTAFTEAERDALKLHGRQPAAKEGNRASGCR